MKYAALFALAFIAVVAISARMYTTFNPAQSVNTAPSQKVEATAVENQPAAEKPISVRVFNKEGQLVGPIEMPKLILSSTEWRSRLTPEQFAILRSQKTERPYCGTLLDNKKEGVYACAGCGLPLFSSDSKFQSGTGWPSFFQPIAKENIIEHQDASHGIVRTEIVCARCDGHLGHVFDDGPKPTGLRFCLNSESLQFTPSDDLKSLADPAAK